MNRRKLLGGSIAAGLLAAMPEMMLAEGLQQRGTGGASWLQLAPAAGLTLGVVSRQAFLEDPVYASFVLNNFKLLVPESDLKFGPLHPQLDTYTFDKADWMVNWGQKHNMLVHGHNLIWNSPQGAAPWCASTLTPTNAAKYLTDHVTTVVKRYKGRIVSWDVVNEPLVHWSNKPGGFYPGTWYGVLGPKYIDLAFQAAAQADPNAMLVLNCYGVEQDSPDTARMRQQTIALLEGMLQRNIPIQGVGIESHLTAQGGNGGAAYAAFLRQLRGLGLKVLVSEFDVDDSAVQGDIATRDKAVADGYYNYLMNVVPQGVRRVTFWLPTDNKNWLDSVKDPKFKRLDGLSHRAGLLDSSLRPKPALSAVTAALTQLSKSNGPM